MSQSFTEGDPVHKTASRALGRPYPPPILMYLNWQFFTHLPLFFKFDQKSAAFIHDLDEKQPATPSQLKLQTLDTVDFEFLVQYEFKNSLLDAIDGAFKTRGGTPIYGLYRYVPRNRLCFLRFSVLK